MRTTLDIPEELLKEAVLLTNSKSKTDAVKIALKELIQKNKIKELKDFKGKVDLDLDLDILRDRK